MRVRTGSGVPTRCEAGESDGWASAGTRRPGRAKAVLLDPGRASAGWGRRRCARRWSTCTTSGSPRTRPRSADRPGGAGRGRRAGPPRARPVLRPRPRAAARRPQGRRAAGRAALVPAVGRRASASTTRCARPGRPSRSRRPTCGPRSGCWRPATSPATPALSDKVARRRPAGLAGRYPRPVRRARRRRARTAGRKSGDVAHRVEPDLKNGHGGLRDIQLIDALAAAQLVDRPGPRRAGGPRTLLLDVPHRAAPPRRPRPRRAARPGRRRGRRRTGDRRPVRAGQGAVRGGPLGRVRRRGRAALGPLRAAAPRARRAAPPAGAPAAGRRRRRARGRGRAGPRRRGGPRPRAGAAGGRDRGPHRAAGRRRHPAPARRHRARAARAVAARGAGRAAVAAGHRAGAWSTSSRRSTAPGCGGGCSPSGARCATCRRATAPTSGPSTGTSSRPARRPPG